MYFSYMVHAVSFMSFDVKLLLLSDAFDNEKLLASMDKLRNGQAVDIPNYDFKSYKNNVFPPRRVTFVFLTCWSNEFPLVFLYLSYQREVIGELKLFSTYSMCMLAIISMFLISIRILN